MQAKQFSEWIKWKQRNKLLNISFPGVYCIAISESDLSGQMFKWIPHISYIGMTNSKGGLKSRLRQFDNTIIGKTGHGGADRFKLKYSNYNELIENLHVSICPFVCDVNSDNPEDLRIMGKVACFEFECIADFVERYGSLPEFNDKKRSPKYSLTQEKDTK